MTMTPFRLDRRQLARGVTSRVRWYHLVTLVAALVATLIGISMTTKAEQSATGTLFEWMPFILKGFALNLVMSFLAMALATILGIGLGVLQISRSFWLSAPARFITHLFRNSPWLVILFIVMYLLPVEVSFLGSPKVLVPDWVKATLAFALPVMGNISEIVRGSINSIPTGQWDSADGLAFTRSQTLRWIILPQCVKRSIPPWMNWYALLTLATPMASILGVHEAVGNAQAAMEAAGGRPDFLIPFYLFLLCLFFAYIYPIAIWTRTLERKYADSQ